jgi:hypothetical protein
VSYQLGESGENLFVLQQLIRFFVSQKGSIVEFLTSVYPFENFPNQTLKSIEVFVSSKGPYRCALHHFPSLICHCCFLYLSTLSHWQKPTCSLTYLGVISAVTPRGSPLLTSHLELSCHPNQELIKNFITEFWAVKLTKKCITLICWHIYKVGVGREDNYFDFYRGGGGWQ